MANTNTNSTGGIGFAGLLTILFIGLKLTNYIDWSWWLVLAPIWIPASVITLLVVVVIAIVVFAKG